MAINKPEGLFTEREIKLMEWAFGAGIEEEQGRMYSPTGSRWDLEKYLSQTRQGESEASIVSRSAGPRDLTSNEVMGKFDSMLEGNKQIADQIAWDRFAAAAISGMLANPSIDILDPHQYASDAKLYANAIMDYRNRSATLENQWRPIVSEPHDGTYLVANILTGHVAPKSDGIISRILSDGDLWPWEVSPTHWVPLPGPPEAGK